MLHVYIYIYIYDISHLRVNPQEILLVLISVRSCKSMKNFNDPFRNRRYDLLASRAMLQPTAPARTLTVPKPFQLPLIMRDANTFTEH